MIDKDVLHDRIMTAKDAIFDIAEGRQDEISEKLDEVWHILDDCTDSIEKDLED